MSLFANIILSAPLGPLTYSFDPELKLQPGQAVHVPFRNKKTLGFVSSFPKEEAIAPELRKKIKPVSEAVEFVPPLLKGTLDLLIWIAEYYHYPAGLVLQHFLPSSPEVPLEKFLTFERTNFSAEEIHLAIGKSTKRKLVLNLFTGSELAYQRVPQELRAICKQLVEKGILNLSIKRSELQSQPLHEPILGPGLNRDQEAAKEAIIVAIENNDPATFLLHGVTGSGKTEVYLHCASAALARGKSVLVMVPEIALTPQLLDRFQRRLGLPIASAHSGLSEKERNRQWHLMRCGEFRVCIGARSAVFAPLQKLGLIVVDEEHDQALKQEDHLRYNARDLAIVLGKMQSCPVVLGSATPSLESFYNGRIGRFKYLQLEKRASGVQLPRVEIIDQSKEPRDFLLSRPLTAALTTTLEKGKQSMLLLNRRGYSSFRICEDCGTVPGCPNCSVSLTHHRQKAKLICHYCGYAEAPKNSCAKCASPRLRSGAPGIETLEQELKNRIPKARLLRIDRDTMEKAGAFEEALANIHAGTVDIIIGTQMIAKGHDFSQVHLVGVVDSDAAFNLPDFRAGERSFQLFTQMSGRAGRAAHCGHVIIQSYNTKHPSLLFSSQHNYRGFAEEELTIRKEFLYPPFSKLTRILITAPTPEIAEATSSKLTYFINRHYQSNEVMLVGPAPAVLGKIQNLFRWSLLIKSRKVAELHKLLHGVQASSHLILPAKASLQIDVDPLSLM